MQPASFPSGKPTQVKRPPDGRPPIDGLRVRTSFTDGRRPNNLLRVRNESSWPAAEFRDYLDSLMRAAGLPNDAALARAAGIDASLISNWRSGKQQPSRRSLKRIAGPLEIRPSALYLQAGLDDLEDLELNKAPDLTVWPAEFRELREVYERFAAVGRGDEVLDAIATLALGLDARIGKGRTVRRRTG